MQALNRPLLAPPPPRLQKVLQEIAVQAKRGPYKDLWGLIRKFAVDAAPE